MASEVLRSNIDGHGGALNALANYWITRLHYEETGESKAAPENNLSDGGASEAFFQFMLSRGDHDEATRSSSGFGIGFELALALTPEAFKSPSGVEAISERDSCALGFQVGFAFALALEREPLDAGVTLQGILNKFFPFATVKTADGGHK